MNHGRGKRQIFRHDGRDENWCCVIGAGIAALLLIVSFLCMWFVIYEPVFRPRWTPATCQVIHMELKRIQTCSEPVNTLELTVSINSSFTHNESILATACTNYYALDSIAGGSRKCWRNDEDSFYPYEFNPYPVWWCGKCNTPDCATASVDREIGWIGPCFWAMADIGANRSPIPFVVFHIPELERAKLLWIWIVFAGVFATISFEAAEYSMRETNLVIHNLALSARWWVFSWRLFFVASQLAHLNLSATVFSRLQAVSPSSDFEVGALTLLIIWVLGVSRWIATHVRYRCRIPHCVRPSLFCVGWCWAWRLDHADAQILLSREMVVLTYIDTWIIHVPFLIVSLTESIGGSRQQWLYPAWAAVVYECVFLVVASWILSVIEDARPLFSSNECKIPVYSPQASAPSQSDIKVDAAPGVPQGAVELELHADRTEASLNIPTISAHISTPCTARVMGVVVNV